MTEQKPLVPAEVDLTDFPFMPILISRLKQSRAWLVCKRRPELAFYMLNLWTASWHGKPASSIEDDDLVLADLAMCPSEKVWAKVKADVMRKWVKCSDGRLYHPVVAEQALEAWARKTSRRAQTESARIAREAAKATEQAKRLNSHPPPTDNVTMSVTDTVTDTEAVNVSDSKGQGQGQGQGKEKQCSAASGGRSVLEIECRALVGEEPVLLAQDFHVLDRLLGDGIEPEDIRTGIREALLRSDPQKRYRRWESFANWCRTAAQNRLASAPYRGSTAIDPKEPRVEFGGGFSAPWSTIRAVWGSRTWLADWGPRPDEPGCKIPPGLLAEIMGTVAA